MKPGLIMVKKNCLLTALWSSFHFFPHILGMDKGKRSTYTLETCEMGYTTSFA